MRKRIILPVLIGMTLILSIFVSTTSIVQKTYAQARTQTSSNGVPGQNSASMVLGSNGGSGRNSAVQGVAGVPSSVHMTGSIIKFIIHRDNPIMEPIPLSTLIALKFIKNFRPVTPARERLP